MDCDRLQPQVTWGISPQQVTSIDGNVPEPSEAEDTEARKLAKKALDYMRLEPGTPLAGNPDRRRVYRLVHQCAPFGPARGGRSVLGSKVKPGMQAVCVPGSTPVKRAAEAEGLDRIFKEAGFEWHESACGFCGHIGDDRFADLRVISTTNRNFEGRQGPKTRTHLASPATVAASAIAGCIADARRHQLREALSKVTGVGADDAHQHRHRSDHPDAVSRWHRREGLRRTPVSPLALSPGRSAESGIHPQPAAVRQSADPARRPKLRMRFVP